MLYFENNYFFIPERFFLRNQEMPRKQANEYFQWYLSQIPFRLKILNELAQKNNIDFDYSCDSLTKLDKLFNSKLSYGKTKRENGKYAMSAESFTLVHDLSIYFGECLIKKSPLLSWQLQKGSKLDVDYQRPVIGGFKYDQNFTIESILMGRVYSILENKETVIKDMLTFQYECWIKEIPEPGKEYILKGVDKDRQQKIPDNVLEEFGVKKDGKDTRK